MNHQDIKDIIGLFTDMFISKELYETRYYDAELKLFYSKVREQDWDALRQFRKTKGETDMPVIVIDGRAPLPTDFHSMQNGGGYYILSGEKVDINFVDESKYDQLLTHKIEYPTEDYPIANIQGSEIRISPKTVRHIIFTYLSKPIKPTYAVTNTRGFLEFNATGSTTVMWSDDDVVLLIQYFLQTIGINATLNEITQKQKPQ